MADIVIVIKTGSPEGPLIQAFGTTGKTVEIRDYRAVGDLDETVYDGLPVDSRGDRYFTQTVTA